jgi:hypothetical protein
LKKVFRAFHRVSQCTSAESGKAVLEDGLAAGGVTTGAAIWWLGANVIGWPEVEAVEAVEGVELAGYEAFVMEQKFFDMFRNAEHAGALIASGLHFGAYGFVGGLGFGMATEEPTVPCWTLVVQQYLDNN